MKLSLLSLVMLISIPAHAIDFYPNANSHKAKNEKNRLAQEHQELTKKTTLLEEQLAACKQQHSDYETIKTELEKLQATLASLETIKDEIAQLKQLESEFVNLRNLATKINTRKLNATERASLYSFYERTRREIVDLMAKKILSPEEYQKFSDQYYFSEKAVGNKNANSAIKNVALIGTGFIGGVASMLVLAKYLHTQQENTKRKRQ